MPATSTAQKMRIREGDTILPIHAPATFQKELEPLPPHVTINARSKKFNQVHWFVRNKAQLEEELDDVIQMVTNDVICWIYYPKGSSGIQTDLTRDKGWEALLQHKEMQWISLISFNETWSAFGMRLQTEKDKKKEAAPKERAIFQYIDPVKKLTFLPDDFAAALLKAPKEEQFYQSLSFTNRKEYLEWIVSAKKEETRATRIRESLDRLSKGWKNPANR